MKPFNLEEAKAGKKVVTRDGREYKFGAHNPEAKEQRRLVGWINNELYTHNERGEYGPLYGLNDLDLVMAEEKVWANVYERNGKIELGTPVHSEERARIINNEIGYIKTIRLKP